MKYQPRTHQGTPEQIIAGLLDEAHDVCTAGTLRLFAKDREMNRIHDELRKHGVEFIVGDREDSGFLIAVKANHPSPCKATQTGYCSCEASLRRIPSYF